MADRPTTTVFAVRKMALVLCVVLAGCGAKQAGSNAFNTDPATAALQSQLDKHPPTAFVDAGWHCATFGQSYTPIAQSSREYDGPFVHARPVAVQGLLFAASDSRNEPNCWDIVWSASSGVKMPARSSPLAGEEQQAPVVIGRYIVDKAGVPDQYGLVPFRAHLVLSSVGNFLEKTNPTVDVKPLMGGFDLEEPVRVVFPLNASDAHALTHKDADGNNLVDSTDYR